MRRWKVILVAKVVLGFATVGTALGQNLAEYTAGLLVAGCEKSDTQACGLMVVLQSQDASVLQRHQIEYIEKIESLAGAQCNPGSSDQTPCDVQDMFGRALTARGYQWNTDKQEWEKQ